jgi:hypothetical protein
MRLSLVGLAVGLCASSAFAQYVISAHSGVVQYVEGRAYINDTLVEPKAGQFPDIKQHQEFRTEEGRAEVLLTPGVFLRMGENSSIRMQSTQLADTRVEVLKGSVMVECDEVSKDDVIVLLYKGNTMYLVKHGLYRVDTNPERFEVFDGEAIVKGESGQVTLKAGKRTSLNGVLMAESFDKSTGDELYRWSSRRAAYLAKANISSATSLRSTGYSGAGLGSWYWNSLFGMYTWVPYRGMGYSPFGYRYWSPVTVSQIYYHPAPVNNTFNGWGGSSASGGSLGYSSNSAGSSYSGGSFSHGAASAPSAPSAPSGGGGAPAAGGGGGAGGARSR